MDPHAPAPDAGRRGEVVVSTTLSMDGLDRAIRNQLPAADWPGLRVLSSECMHYRKPPFSLWVQRAIVVAGALLAMIAVAASVDQSIGRRCSLQVLARIGTPLSVFGG